MVNANSMMISGQLLPVENANQKMSLPLQNLPPDFELVETKANKAIQNIPQHWRQRKQSN
jgi:hypothetical protein